MCSTRCRRRVVSARALPTRILPTRQFVAWSVRSGACGTAAGQDAGASSLPSAAGRSASTCATWNRTTVQSFLDVRTAVLNDNLEDAFRLRYPGFRPTNDDQVLSEAA